MKPKWHRHDCRVCEECDFTDHDGQFEISSEPIDCPQCGSPLVVAMVSYGKGGSAE